MAIWSSCSTFYGHFTVWSHKNEGTVMVTAIKLAPSLQIKV